MPNGVTITTEQARKIVALLEGFAAVLREKEPISPDSLCALLDRVAQDREPLAAVRYRAPTGLEFVAASADEQVGILQAALHRTP